MEGRCAIFSVCGFIQIRSDSPGLFAELNFMSVKIAGLSKQPKAGKASLKKDVAQANPPAASDKKTDERLPDKDRKKDVPQPRMQFDDVHRVVKAKKRSVVNQSEARNRVELFRHLPQYAHGTQLPELESKFFQPDLMHPSVYKVTINYHVANIL